MGRNAREGTFYITLIFRIASLSKEIGLRHAEPRILLTMGIISPDCTQQLYLGMLAFILQSSDQLHIYISLLLQDNLETIKSG